MHPPGDRRQVLRLHLHRPRHLRLRRVGDLGEISRLHRFQQVGGIARPPVGQGGDVVGQLDGGDLGALLTDGHGQHVALIPFAPKGLGKLRAGHHTSGLGQLHPCLLTQAELGGVLVQLLDAHPPAYIIEEVVAGYLDGVGYVDRSVGASILAVDPALRLGRRPIGVLPLIPDDGGGGDDFLLQPGDGADHLEGGTGGIQTAEGPVIQGLQRVVQQAVVVLPKVGEGVGGVGGGGQDLPGPHILHHAGRPLHRVAQPGDPGGQGVLHLLLEAQVDGEEHVAPRLGGQALPCLLVRQPLGGDDLAIFIALQSLLPRSPVEVLLKGGLRAGDAHGIVHVVAALLLIGRPGILGDGAGVA